jgi:hypothetical protein
LLSIQDGFFNTSIHNTTATEQRTRYTCIQFNSIEAAAKQIHLIQ